VIALQSGGRARWTPRDYAALAREGYVKNAIVYRAVKLVAENVGGCAFLVEEGAETRDRHPPPALSKAHAPQLGLENAAPSRGVFCSGAHSEKSVGMAGTAWASR